MKHSYQVFRNSTKSSAGHDDAYNRKLRCKNCGVETDLLQRDLGTGIQVGECQGKSLRKSTNLVEMVN